MKHLILAAFVFATVNAFGQSKVDIKASEKANSAKDLPKDTVKIPLQSAPQKPAYFYLVMTADDWNEVLSVMDASEYPANKINRYKNYIIKNLTLVTPPAPSGGDKK